MGLSLSLSPSPSPSITMDYGLLDQAPVCYRRSHNIWTRILAKTRLILAKHFFCLTAKNPFAEIRTVFAKIRVPNVVESSRPRLTFGTNRGQRYTDWLC